VTRALAALAMLAVLGAAGEAPAASFTLTEADKRAAIRTGERSITTETFDREWQVSNGGGETASVLTPFHRLTMAARNAAFKNDPLKPADVDRIVKESTGRLLLWVNLRGRSEDFARYYVPRLLAGDREIKATFVQNERTPIRQDTGGFVARCIYGFSTQDLSGTSRVTLVVADADGNDVSRFTINLAGMR
jgi:hypothetical protein